MDITTKDHKDIAILYRVHSQSRAIEDYFIMNDVPYVSYADTSFFNRKEIVDVITYLNIATNPRGCELKDFKRIANRPTRYVSNKAMDKLEDASFDLGMGIWETDLVTGNCPLSHPWFKNRRFMNSDYKLYYVWADITVNDHQSDIWEWTITGSYNYGNLNVNPANNPSIPFMITESNPIP